MIAKHWSLGAVAAVAAALVCEAGLAAGGASTAAAQQSLIDQFTVRWDTEGRVRRDIVEEPSAPAGAVFEASVRSRLDEPWRSRVTVPFTRDIKAGDTIELQVWLRADRTIRGLDTGNLDLQIVRTSEPYDNIFSENIRPTEEGQYYTVTGVAAADFDADDVVFGANLGYGRQTIQFGAITIRRLSSGE